jgi:hypothetical protein
LPHTDKQSESEESIMKELNIFCLAVILLAGALNTGVALMKGGHAAPVLAQVDVGQIKLAENP